MKVKIISINGREITVKPITVAQQFNLALTKRTPMDVLRASLSVEDFEHLDNTELTSESGKVIDELYTTIVELNPSLYGDDKKKEVSGNSSTGVPESSGGIQVT